VVIMLAGSGSLFHLYGISQWVVLFVTVLGSVRVVVAGRQVPEPIVRAGCRGLAVVIVGLNLGEEIWEFRPTDAIHTLPLQLSDLAPYLAGIALWSRARWAYCLTEYWCLVLSSQALITPALGGPDFPSVSFLVFFANHVLVVWAAMMLVWGLNLRLRWRDYWFAVVVTGGMGGGHGCLQRDRRHRLRLPQRQTLDTLAAGPARAVVPPT
jgi:hypothetical integral membrane protein (TIGR02206 family)